MVELVEVVSTGDVVRDRPLYEVGGVGIFTKEVQDALLDGRADLAVHSLKDLPTVEHADLTLAAVPIRGPVNDVLLAPQHKTVANLPEGARVATSSLRRRAQLLRARPDIQIVDIRGNVETRIRKLHEQELDGLILAAAGVIRLGLDNEVTEHLTHELMLPAVGQGALGIECRRDAPAVQSLLAELEDTPTRQAVTAERSFLRVLQGGCQLPVGAHARLQGDQLVLAGNVIGREGTPVFEGEIAGSPDDGEKLGADLAHQLLSEGADGVLR